MARLYRPHIPLSVRVPVAERQFRELYPEKLGYCFDPGLNPRGNNFGRRLRVLLPLLASAFGCELKDLRLDHDPPLALRWKLEMPDGKIEYTPDANDPEHLVYRPHGAQFEGSHDVKTRVRGDHGQFSDLALIRREKRRQRKAVPKKKWRSRKTVWPKRSFQKRKAK